MRTTAATTPDRSARAPAPGFLLAQQPGLLPGLVLGLLLGLHSACAFVPRVDGSGPLLAPGYPVDADVSHTAGLFHWVDSLAGTSAGKTVAAHRRQYAWTFGVFTQPDYDQLVALRGVAAACIAQRPARYG